MGYAPPVMIVNNSSQHPEIFLSVAPLAFLPILSIQEISKDSSTYR